ncbi:methyl-accepting chemotaxis protein [Acuticoccus sp. I52.16.1]|uniref:methyl-accepting chemotaxis protein n=1 Tax=Acuticoccus sp. I52.16.1 TaxID=2928472 RepID=UPI001FD08004|nr:HAMP domain-containing methyl-accepting chemotaxis protein [Acuticoccus sp. I52.16.1]UOM34947.1 methyl-accepting chemotaxis protein [Acuticoccus sp. I52.16.1]
MEQVFGRAANPINNVGLPIKLVSAIVLILAFLGGVFFAGNRGIDQIERLFHDYRDVTARDILLSDLRRRVLGGRLAVSNFVAADGDYPLEPAAEGVAAMVASADRAAGTTTGDVDLDVDLARVRGLTGEYAALFDDLAQSEARYRALIAELDANAEAFRVEMEAVLKWAFSQGGAEGNLDVATFEEHALLGEAATLRFLLGNDPAHADAARGEFEEARAAIERYSAANFQRERETKASVAALATFEATFERMVPVLTERTRILNAMVEMGQSIVADVQRLADLQEEAQKEIDAASPAAIEAAKSMTLWLSALGLLASIVVAGVLVVSLVPPIRRVTAVMNRVAAGDTDFEVRERNSRDELGQIWTAIGKLRITAHEALMRAQMIEQVPTPVMIADPNDDFRITFMNTATRQQLKRIEHLLPINVEEMDGQSIDIFHKSGQHQRKLLSDPSRLPYTATINLGGEEYLTLTCSAVRDNQDRYVATMLSWQIITKTVKSTSVFETSVKATMEQMTSTFGGMRDRVHTIVGGVEVTQSELTAGAAAVSQAAGNVQMVAAAAEELASTITEIASRTTRSSDHVALAAKSTREVALQAERLAEASARIGEVVDAISEIAGKTNLLALNATIEAASAGEAGKGFAVVAQEVKSLATQTAKATQEVAEQIAEIQSQVTVVVNGISGATEVIEEMRDTFSSVAAAVEEQQTATHEITVNAQHAAVGVEAASKTIAKVEQLSADNLDAANRLASATTELSEANDNLGRESDSFLQVMKAV